MRAEDILPEHMNQDHFNGVAVRKGTVGAFLANARTWIDPAASSSDRLTAERDIIEALPALRALGLFNILDVRNEALRTFVASN